MEKFLVIQKIEGTEKTRLAVVIYADPASVADIERSLLVDCQKKGIPYVHAEPTGRD